MKRKMTKAEQERIEDEDAIANAEVNAEMCRERYTFNDLLLDKGPEAVAEAIANAKPYDGKK